MASISDRDARNGLRNINHGQLRPQSHEYVLRGVYSSLYIGTNVTRVNLTDVIVLGEIHVWGSNITGRVYTYNGANVIAGKPLTVTQCDPVTLYKLALDSQQ